MFHVSMNFMVASWENLLILLMWKIKNGNEVYRKLVCYQHIHSLSVNCYLNYSQSLSFKKIKENFLPSFLICWWYIQVAKFCHAFLFIFCDLHFNFFFFFCLFSLLAVLVSRQFVDMSRIRIEGLLAAFPKLVGTGKQHTYVETENVRYVYQPIEALYLLLVTNKQSNILEDLETLRLLSKLVSFISWFWLFIGSFIQCMSWIWVHSIIVIIFRCF